MRISELRDWDSFDDLDPDGREATGLYVYAQEIWHGLISERGTIIDAPNTGIDIESWIHKEFSQRTLSELSGSIKNECFKDERTTGCVVSVTPSGLRALSIRIVLSTDDGDVTLSGEVSEAGALIKGIQ